MIRRKTWRTRCPGYQWQECFHEGRDRDQLCPLLLNQGPQGTETKDNDLQSPDALGVSSTWHCPVGTVPSLAHTAHRVYP